MKWVISGVGFALSVAILRGWLETRRRYRQIYNPYTSEWEDEKQAARDDSLRWTA